MIWLIHVCSNQIIYEINFAEVTWGLRWKWQGVWLEVRRGRTWSDEGSHLKWRGVALEVTGVALEVTRGRPGALEVTRGSLFYIVAVLCFNCLTHVWTQLGGKFLTGPRDVKQTTHALIIQACSFDYPSLNVWLSQLTGSVKDIFRDVWKTSSKMCGRHLPECVEDIFRNVWKTRYKQWVLAPNFIFREVWKTSSGTCGRYLPGSVEDTQITEIICSSICVLFGEPRAMCMKDCGNIANNRHKATAQRRGPSGKRETWATQPRFSLHELYRVPAELIHELLCACVWRDPWNNQYAEIGSGSWMQTHCKWFVEENA